MIAYLLIIVGLISVGVGAYLLITASHSSQHSSAVVAQASSPAPAYREKASDLTEQEQKGKDFEDYVANHLFHPDDYTIVERVNDYNGRTQNTERAKYADFIIRSERLQKEFAVECKYRTSWKKGKNGKDGILWAEEKKIQDYNEDAQHRNIDYIILIGVGGEPSKPECLFSVPLKHLQYPKADFDYLNRFRLKLDHGYVRYNQTKHNLDIQ